jgi:tRNA nucleotidyltransferase (CCA-adding enzyme)
MAGGRDADTEGLDVYLVGGAVRDALLGLPAGDRDWVVVGATPEQMAERGFIPIGGDFPVFLHPATKEEYALARTERKSGRGYKGFTFYTGADVSLHDDLCRRDLTINAMAQDRAGNIIDPMGGRGDIDKRLLRHVGRAFAEDPVRLLRLARFAARFPEFSVAGETMALARQLVASGEVDALVPERVWQEIVKGLNTNDPGRMLGVLEDTGALERVAPGLVFSGAVSDALARAARNNLNLASRFALLCGKSADPDAIGKALRAPNDCRHYARLLPAVVSDAGLAEPVDWLTLLEKCDALRKPQRFMDLIVAARCVRQVDVQAWARRVAAVGGIDAGAIAGRAQGRPERIRDMMREARLAALAATRSR